MKRQHHLVRTTLANNVQRLYLLIRAPTRKVFDIHADDLIEAHWSARLRWQRNMWSNLCFTKVTFMLSSQIDGSLASLGMLENPDHVLCWRMA